MGNVLSGWDKKNFDLEPQATVKTSASGLKTEKDQPSESIGQTPQHNGMASKGQFKSKTFMSYREEYKSTICNII